MAGKALSLGFAGILQLAWRSAAATLGLAGAISLVAALPSLMAEPDFAVSPAHAANFNPPPSRTSADFNLTWQTITRPIAVFGLDSIELERLPLVYEARRALGGTERDDTLRFGRFTEKNAHFHIAARRSHDHAEPSSRFFIDLAREASRHDLALDKIGTTMGQPTKFGMIETADALLSDAGSQRSCVVFRHLSTQQPLRLSGWWCGTVERPADRSQLTCLIDRFDLLSAGDDKPLRQLFAQAELNRSSSCSVSRLAMSGRKSNWLDADGKAPELKRAVAQGKVAKSAPRSAQH